MKSNLWTPAPSKETLVAGSLVFTMTEGAVDLKDFSQQWKWTVGGNGKHSKGPDINLDCGELVSANVLFPF